MDDLISRSEAIRVASGYCHWTNIPAELAKLPSVSTEKTGRWIPVSERLPEIGQRVLVTYNQEDKLKVDTTIFDRHGFLIGIVTAWMPLPQPYEFAKMEVAEETETYKERVTLNRIKNFGKW